MLAWLAFKTAMKALLTILIIVTGIQALADQAVITGGQTFQIKILKDNHTINDLMDLEDPSLGTLIALMSKSEEARQLLSQETVQITSSSFWNLLKRRLEFKLSGFESKSDQDLKDMGVSEGFEAKAIVANYCSGGVWPPDKIPLCGLTVPQLARIRDLINQAWSKARSAK